MLERGSAMEGLGGQLSLPHATSLTVRPTRRWTCRMRRLLRGYGVVLAILCCAVPRVVAADLACRSGPTALPQEHGSAMLLVDYQAAAITVGGNFSLDVRVENDPGNQGAPEQFFQITEIRFHSDRIICRQQLPPKKVKQEGKWVTSSTYNCQISDDAKPNVYEGLVIVQPDERPSLQERICVPVGSEGEEYLTVKPNPLALTLHWGEAAEVALDMHNTYPYPYYITRVKPMPPANAPYGVEPPKTDTPEEVRQKNSNLRAKVTAKHAWSALLAVSNPRREAELRLTYKDQYDRLVEEKAIRIPLTILPPAWLLWLLAMGGGLGGGALRYIVGGHGNPGPSLRYELLVGVLMAFVIYLVFQLGGISILVSNLSLTLDNDTGVVAVFLGLLGGWRGKGVLERLV